MSEWTTSDTGRGIRLALGPMSPHWTGGMEYYRLLRAAFATLPEAERPVTGLLTWDAEADASKCGDLADEFIVIAPNSAGTFAGPKGAQPAFALGNSGESYDNVRTCPPEVRR